MSEPAATVRVRMRVYHQTLNAHPGQVAEADPEFARRLVAAGAAEPVAEAPPPAPEGPPAPAGG